MLSSISTASNACLVEGAMSICLSASDSSSYLRLSKGSYLIKAKCNLSSAASLKTIFDIAISCYCKNNLNVQLSKHEFKSAIEKKEMKQKLNSFYMDLAMRTHKESSALEGLKCSYSYCQFQSLFLLCAENLESKGEFTIHVDFD